MSKDQRDQISTTILEEEGRNALNSIFAVGVLHTAQQYFPEIINKASTVPKEMLEAAQTLFDTSPISGILNFLPKEAKMIISVFTVLLLIWAGAHMLFLVITFAQKIKKFGIISSFKSNFAPTMQIHTLTERTDRLASLVTQLQDTVNNNQRNSVETQSEIIDRVRAIEEASNNQ